MVKSIVVVGGGAAGWITAGLLGAKYIRGAEASVSVTVVESENIGIIGVGEGTWPTMVDTLRKMGIEEIDFIRNCDATFKQASKFRCWTTGEEDDSYYHPFSLPQRFEEVSLAAEWRDNHRGTPFATAVGLQADLCDRKCAPKQVSSPEYASVENHGYHLDAGKFTKFLTAHCRGKLGVNHILADVVSVNTAENGDILSLTTQQGAEITGDLFIDCSGSAGLLIDKHYQVPFLSQKDVLFIDSALAVQVPYEHPDAEIESATLSTAQTAGWIWDIGLSSRRGVGHVFSSRHISDAEATEQLKNYLRPDVPDVEALSFRKLSFQPGYRAKFWVNNCVAVGMSAGFIEPLEASALVMVELAANTISQHLPASRAAMDVVATKYNETFLFRWQRVIDFLKLHYVLSRRRDSAFWRDNQKAESIPESLQDLLTLWRHQSPSNNGFLSPYDLFPAASYQYILYGMGFRTHPNPLESMPHLTAAARTQLEKVKERKVKVLPRLPGNRELINGLCRPAAAVELNLVKTTSGSWRRVAPDEVDRMANHCPLFFRRDSITAQFECIALVGLAQDETLIEAPEIPVTGGEGETSGITLSPQEEALLEPVKLDIAFSDKSTLLITGLHVVNREKLSGLSARNRRRRTALFQTMQESLQHVSALIEMRNRQLMS
ncbi:tryptophan 7-halogenase [Paremcibacter congregatus]|uniref:Tryptophan halogenase n=1 Tax=Paremcibacter congregatus TaxID=2043170 RepID=A0A2G4YWA7_9PROT|nr:tryptophan 7-halogenase [Paremcibacter congregatus]PHZ86621.1 tryptophan halogenase [Paremcibacter congregatus]QDE26423.1 tryptophan 7-halogenase [Paremcibacter congregatus]